MCFVGHVLGSYEVSYVHKTKATEWAYHWSEEKCVHSRVWELFTLIFDSCAGGPVCLDCVQRESDKNACEMLNETWKGCFPQTCISEKMNKLYLY